LCFITAFPITTTDLFELVIQISQGVISIGKCLWSPGNNSYRSPLARYDRGTPLPYDLKMPGFRQRCFSLLGNGPALANLARMGLRLGWFHKIPLFKCAEQFRSLWKMNINGTSNSGHLCSSSNGRRLPARMSRSPNRIYRFGLEDGPTAYSRCASQDPDTLVPLVHAVATDKSIRSCRSRVAV